MISISLSDIIKAMEHEEGYKYKEQDLLTTKTDDLLLQYASTFGLDNKFGYALVYNKHRNLQGDTLFGYRVVGEIRTDRLFLNSPFCSVEDRAIAQAGKDVGLALELFGMLGSRVNYGMLKDEDEDADDLAEGSYLETDYGVNTLAMRYHEDVCTAARGSPFNEFGKLKNYQEWQDTVVK